MSRYLLLILLTLPFIVAAILGAIVSYKLKKLSFKKTILRIVFWLILLVGLILAESIYNFLFTRGLTQTEPLSLFDVIQLTLIVFVLFMLSRNSSKVERLEKRVQDLHQELSIRISGLKD